MTQTSSVTALYGLHHDGIFKKSSEDTVNRHLHLHNYSAMLGKPKNSVDVEAQGKLTKA